MHVQGGAGELIAHLAGARRTPRNLRHNLVEEEEMAHARDVRGDALLLT